MHIFVFFTFQPGYIQMINVSVCRSWICTLYIPTWLYSNRNAVGWVQGAFSLYIPTWLYSNSYTPATWRTPVAFFTFQPGYIQMHIKTHSRFLPFCFTFQPGYIQIKPKTLPDMFLHSLHSNLVIFKWCL